MKSMSQEEWKALAESCGADPAEMTEHLAVSRRQLQRRARRDICATPSQLARSIKVEKAMALLQAGWRTKEVANQLNFSSERHFCRWFKDATGLTPQEYATKQANKPASRARKSAC